MEPKLLTTLSGNPVTTKEDWERYRRNECITLLTEYAYGHAPAYLPEDLQFSSEIVNNDLEGMILKKITVSFKGFSYTANAFYKPSDKPLPTFLYYMHIKEERDMDTDIEKCPTTENIPIRDIVQRGYAVIVLYFTSIHIDDLCRTDYETSIFKVFSPPRPQRDESEWSAIGAWAWASSRLMDYIETDDTFDRDRVAIVGHSRGGKTALWAGALDRRFAFIVSNSSGCMGAAMLRGKTGEHLAYITSHTDWLCKKLNRFIENEDMLPIDQHMLLACIAPRPLYVESNSQDEWSDPASERRGAILASEVYELYGQKGIVIPDEPEIGTSYHEGMIGYHVSEGTHKIRKHDWDKFMDFWEKKQAE